MFIRNMGVGTELHFQFHTTKIKPREVFKNERGLLSVGLLFTRSKKDS